MIQHNLSQYLVFEEESIEVALRKMNQNKVRTIFAIRSDGETVGVVSDGDFRRWLLTQRTIDLSIPVTNLINKKFISVSIDEVNLNHSKLFKNGIDAIPVLDKRNRILGILTDEPEKIEIAGIEISKNAPAFIIAEIGNNHNGSLNLAKELVDLAVESGANCVKFQYRDLESLYRNQGNSNDHSADLGTQYTLDLLNKYQLTRVEMGSLFEYCKTKECIAMCTPWDFSSLDFLKSFDLPAYKIASADLTNHDFYRAVAAEGKPIIQSTGMSLEREILEHIRLSKELNAKVVYLHCNSTYPTPFKDVNLRYLEKLEEAVGGIVGYSGHERGFHIVLAAVALGAKVIEKHFTLDRNMEGNDHRVSLLPQEFSEMVRQIRDLEAAMGASADRSITQGELMNRENLAKSLVANTSITKGTLILNEMVGVCSPGQGLQPNLKSQLLGKLANRDIRKGDFFFESDLKDLAVKARNFKLQRKWGVPVRFHDFKSLCAESNPNLVEFHLSYKDLEVDITQFLGNEKKRFDLVVHAPELFAADHILDLASSDQFYRRKSILELKRVVEVTKNLRAHFQVIGPTPIVVNVGGASDTSLASKIDKVKMYSDVAAALIELQDSSVEFIPQTMPPFPWHFGGQRFHHLFVEADEIIRFCKETGFKICFDISHSFLACKQLKISFSEFVASVAPFSTHLHIADGQGTDGEGLQIGEGEIDFVGIAKILGELAPNATFIPEVWQGHKNNGEGFWKALDAMERMGW